MTTMLYINGEAGNIDAAGVGSVVFGALILIVITVPIAIFANRLFTTMT